MKYKIITNDLWKNAEGNYELFFQIEINDGTEIWTKAARLPASDVALVRADPLAINDIALTMANNSVMTRPQEKIEEENMRLYRLEQIKLEVVQEEAKVEQIKLEQLKLDYEKI